MTQNFIYLLAFASFLSSVLVITSKNPVIAVIFLISVFVNAAGYLILLGIGFIGISYIIIYIGAITVLFLFVIMLLNIRLSEIIETSTQYTKILPLALGIAALFIYEFFTIIPFSFNNVTFISSLLNITNQFNGLLLNINESSFVDLTMGSVNPDTAIFSFSQIQTLSHNLYTFGAGWLIIISLILLLAMVAPIFISKFNSKIGGCHSPVALNKNSSSADVDSIKAPIVKPTDQFGLFVRLKNLTNKLPDSFKFAVKLILFILFFLKLIGINNIFDVYNNQKFISYALCSLNLSYHFINLFLLQLFRIRKFQIPEILPNSLINWLEEFKILSGTKVAFDSTKNMFYIEIVIYFSIIVLIYLI